MMAGCDVCGAWSVMPVPYPPGGDNFKRPFLEIRWVGLHPFPMLGRLCIKAPPLGR